MDNSDSLKILFSQFQRYIYNNKLKIKGVKIKPYSVFWTFVNPLDAKGFWLLASVLFNAAAFLFYQKHGMSSESAATISMFALLLTVASRTPIVNRIFFIISAKVKCYFLHQIIYQLGMFHRFMALTSFAWLTLYFFKNSFEKPYIDEYLLISLLILISIILLTSIKKFRAKRHDLFENIHRYCSYLALIILISYFHVTSQQQAMTLESYLNHSNTYILLLTLILSIIPWVGVKTIRPIIQHVGSHVIALKLKGKPQYGSFSRITLGDSQFHSFGDSVFDVNDKDCFSLYISASGDRTKQIVEAANKGINLLKKCTIRRDRSYGFMYHVATYDHVLIVATGGGIAPVLPHLTLNKTTKIVLLWIGHDQVKEFTNDFFLKLKNKINSDNIYIHMLNSSLPWVKKMSLEQTVGLILKAHGHYQTEAVFIVSNPLLTNKTLLACKQEKIKAYGATFDS